MKKTTNDSAEKQIAEIKSCISQKGKNQRITGVVWIPIPYDKKDIFPETWEYLAENGWKYHKDLDGKSWIRKL